VLVAQLILGSLDLAAPSRCSVTLAIGSTEGLSDGTL